jgi:hypothetical protein
MPANQSYFKVSMTQLICLKLSITLQHNGFQCYAIRRPLRVTLGIVRACVIFALQTKFINTSYQILEQYKCVSYILHSLYYRGNYLSFKDVIWIAKHLLKIPYIKINYFITLKLNL